MKRMGTVEKVLDILEVFLNQQREISISELANLSRLNISTVHHITSMLVNRGYLSQAHKRGKYSIGVKFLEFGSIARNSIKIANLAIPFLEELNKVTDESVNLAILDSNEAVYIEHIESSHTLRTFTEVGNRVPLYCTGVGKVLLAHMTEEELERFFNSNRLISYTDNTITDLSQLKKQLTVIKHEGIAIDKEEMESGVKCIASPVRDWNGNIVAAISISGPSTRLTSKRMEELRSLIKSSASKISRAMGYKGE